MHKIDTDLIVMEDQRVKDLYLRDRADTNDSLSNYAKITFATHDDVVHIGTIRYSWPEVSLGVGAGRSNVGNVADDIFNVTVCILLHTTCTC